MRLSKLLSALLLVGALTLAVPGIASAHAEGRANCRYATQQTGVFSLLLMVPISLLCLWWVSRQMESLEASKVDRALAVGEPAY